MPNLTRAKTVPLLMALALALAASGAHAELVWKWTGPNGKPVFGKTAPPGVRAEQVNIMSSKPGAFAKTGNTVDLSKLPNAPKPPKAGEEPATPFCPPQVSSCRAKLAPGDRPMTPAIPEAPPERDKKGNPMR